MSIPPLDLDNSKFKIQNLRDGNFELINFFLGGGTSPSPVKVGATIVKALIFRSITSDVSVPTF
jgi:hypothetical protein